MPSIPLYALLDALSRLTPEFTDLDNAYADLPKILPIVSDFLADNFNVEGMVDALEGKLASLSSPGRRIYLMIIGIIVNGGVIPILSQNHDFKPAQFAEQVALGSLPNIAESLGKLVSPSFFARDQDRAEELCRKIVHALSLTIDGETAEESKTRLFQLDTLELDKINQDVQRKIQEALEEARRREAAAKPSGE